MAQTPIEVDLTNDTPPHWTTQGATTPLAETTAAAELPTCAICLHDIHRAAIGPNAPYDWPACSHPIHLRCAMQHVSHQAQPACPTWSIGQLVNLVCPIGQPVSGTGEI